ncbi:MAG: ATP-binding protein [Oscillatoria princeps RMCB-10]|jgi:AAA15 family ATPase/GTPase|nr:ATP-binding protein [Oscillatoria princeps RMCB-10]
MLSRILLENLGGFTTLSWPHHSNINLIAGGNDTGKTYLLKMLYSIAKSVEDFTKREKSDKPAWRDVLAEKLFWVYQPEGNKLGELVRKGESRLKVEARLSDENYTFSFSQDTARKIAECTEPAAKQPGLNALFIPPKEVLTALEAIAATRDQLQIFGFDDTYYDLIKALRLPASQEEIPQNIKEVLDSLKTFLAGEIQRQDGQFIFKRNGEKYWMSQTAEGFKKLGIFTALIRNRTLRKGTILFIDEPESNLHPSAILSLADMLFALSQAQIQLYVSTHSYFVLKRFEILAKKHQARLQFCSLKKSERGITAEFSDLSEGMPDNEIIDASIKLYEQDVEVDLEA